MDNADFVNDNCGRPQGRPLHLKQGINITGLDGIIIINVI